MAEYFYSWRFEEKENVNLYGKNIKEIFGVPAKYLKKLTVIVYQERNFIDVLQKVYANAPEFLELCDAISPIELHFFEENVIPLIEGETTQIRGFRNYGRKIQLRIAKHLWSTYRSASFLFPMLHWGESQLYIDYLNMAYRLNPNRPQCGYTPKDIRAAHDEVLELVGRNHLWDNINESEFLEAVNRESYIKKASVYEEDAEKFAGEDYEIICPSCSNDLRLEGKALHHCVGTYINNVIDGSSCIYFLRKIEDPMNPYGTIEVCRNEVIQVKGRCNHKVELDAQKFVKKWAKIKKLQLNTLDLNI